MSSQILSQNFFDHSPLKVAPELLGSFLVHEKEDGEIIKLMIREVEAYDGVHDQASHSAKGKTPRTEIMFGPAGFWYVYLIYGIYDMLNIVTGPGEHASAVLIRSAGDFQGPGRLTKALGISKKSFHGKVIAPETKLWIEKGEIIDPQFIERTPRIGVDYAGPIWSSKPYRFLLNR